MTTVRKVETVGVPVISAQTLQFEVEGRLEKVRETVGKTHVSVRWESAPRIARVGVMLDSYDWDNRMRALRTVREFEAEHEDDFALEFDILPLDATTDHFAEA